MVGTTVHVVKVQSAGSQRLKFGLSEIFKNSDISNQVNIIVSKVESERDEE